MVALLDLLPGSLGTDRAINRALDEVAASARAEAAGAPLREALEGLLKAVDASARRFSETDEDGAWSGIGLWVGDLEPELGQARAASTATPAPDSLDVEALRLPWHRETVGHLSTAGIVASVAADLNVPLDEGLPPNTDATWIVNADNKVVAFVGNGPRQTHNADAIIAALTARTAATEDTDA